MTTATRLITPEMIVGSRPVIFEPKLGFKPKPNDKPKYFLRGLLPHAAIATPAFKAIVAAVIAKGEAEWKNDFKVMFKEKAIRSPFREDVGTKGYDTDAFAYYVNLGAFEDNVIGVVGRDTLPVMDRGLFYAGCKVRAEVKVRVVNRVDNKCIMLDIVNVQWLGHGERIKGGESDPAGAFGPALDAEADDGATGGDALADMLR